MDYTDTLLETPRLLLRRHRPADFQDVYACLSDAEVVRYEPYRPMTPEEVQKNLEWRISAPEMIAVEHRQTGRLIGNIYLGRRDFGALELGYVFNRRYWGYGYAREGCCAAVNHAFLSGTHRIFAECDPENIHSWRLLEALGFTREAHLRQNIYFWKDENGQPIWKDTYIYGKLSSGSTASADPQP